jgi:hypothetical protein
MSTASQPDMEKTLRLVGAIVLVSQDAERHLKIILPFIGTPENPSLSAAIQQREKLKNRPLGPLAKKFVDSTSTDSLDFATHMNYLVDTRNLVVHHFFETYGTRLSAGNHQEVFDSLDTLLGDLKNLLSMLEQVALVVFEGLRDVTFRDSPQYEQMAELCASFRKRVTS